MNLPELVACSGVVSSSLYFVSATANSTMITSDLKSKLRQFCKPHRFQNPKKLSRYTKLLVELFWEQDIWGALCQKQVSRVGTSNYIPYYPWNVITCPYSWYMHLVQHARYITTHLKCVLHHTSRVYKQRCRDAVTHLGLTSNPVNVNVKFMARENPIVWYK